MRRIIRFGLLAILIVTGIFLVGSHRQATGGAYGGAIGQLPPPATYPALPFTFRVGTFNIHSGIGADEKFDLNRTASTISEVDLCGLQEVRGYIDPSTNQAVQLGQLLSCNALFAPSERRFWHDDFGNGVLTKIPLSRWVRIPLPTDGSGGLRNVLYCDAIVGTHTIHVLITHIDRHTDQSEELRYVATVFESVSPPALLLGDLNVDYTNPDVAAMLNHPGVVDCVGTLIGTERDRIDWILARGLKPKQAAKVANGASDHPFYWAELEIP